MLDDLKPYVCIFEKCPTADRLYERYSDWSTHEREVHRKEWFCNSCNAIFADSDLFQDHLVSIHPQNYAGKEQLG